MHRHLYLVVTRPKVERETLRPAKVISLEVRRQARVERARPQPQPQRPAA
jgi:hypothetical protein